MWWYIVQLAIILLTILSANEEYNGTAAFRKYEATVSKENKLYHRWGAAFIAVMCAAFPILLYHNSLAVSKLSVFILFIISWGGWYWLLFDIIYANLIGQKWWYLGGSADSDIGLIKLLGEHAGKIKAFACIILIVVLNLVHEIFLK